MVLRDLENFMTAYLMVLWDLEILDPSPIVMVLRDLENFVPAYCNDASGLGKFFMPPCCNGATILRKFRACLLVLARKGDWFIKFRCN